MVLTRSSRSQPVSEGGVHNTVLNMENMPRTSQQAMAPPPVSSASMQNPTTTTANVAPAVQQFMSLAHDRTGFSHDSSLSHTTITPPEYSSITARNVQQEFRQNVAPAAVTAPPAVNNLVAGVDMFTFMREELARQMTELRNTMQQEIVRAVSEATGSPRNTQNAARSTSFGVLNPEPQPMMQHPPGSYQPVQQLVAPHPVQQQQQPPVYAAHSSPAPSLPPEFTFTTPRKVDLSKWGIKFDGSTKSMSAEDFIFRVDVLRQDYNCSFNDIRRSFHLLLEGQALDWYWNVRKLNPVQTWDDLVKAFLTQFRRYESEFQLQKQIMDRRQMPQESFENFYNAVMKLRNQQQNPYSERDIVEIMKSNLKPSLSHLLFSVRTDSINEFCQQAKRAENLLYSQRQQFQARQHVPLRVQEIEYEDEESPIHDAEVDALTADTRFVCWNCKIVGHSFMDCPNPIKRIFCFRCGKENVVAPKCPKCQGNRSRNPSRTGEMRSTEV